MRLNDLVIVPLFLFTFTSAFLVQPRLQKVGLLKRTPTSDRIKRNQFNPRASRVKIAPRAYQSGSYCSGYKNAAGQCVDTCEKTTSGYTQSEDGGCTCTQFDNGTKCVMKCNQGTAYIQNINGGCDCAAGFISPKNDANCVAVCPQASLNSGFTQSGDGGCVCSGYNSGIKCVQQTDCAANFDFSTSTGCTCGTAAGSNYELVGGACVQKCGSGFTRVAGQCTCDTTQNDIVANSCLPKCTSNFTRDPSTSLCTVCDTNKNTIQNGACVTACPSSSLSAGYSQAVSGGCTCTGYDSGSKCVKQADCGANFTYSTSTGCTCGTTSGSQYELFGTSCVAKCGTNFVRNSSTGVCACPTTNGFTYTSRTNTCTCSGYANMSGSCVSQCSISGYTQREAGGCQAKVGQACANSSYGSYGTSGSSTIYCPTGSTCISSYRGSACS